MPIFDSLNFEVGLDMGGFERGLRSIIRKADSASADMSRAFAAVGAAASAAAAAVGAIGVSAIQTGAQFETFETQFETVLGSAGAASQRMADLFEVASTTPFNLDQVVEADLVLERFGQSAADLRGPVMDLSAALGLTLPEAAAQVGRAFTAGAGSADLLRDRGVIAMIELREGVKSTEMAAEDFQRALVDALTDPAGRIAGGTQRLASTFSGLVSNLQDEWTRFSKGVADAGLFDGVKGGLRETLAIIDENRAALGTLAEELGIGLLAGLQTAILFGGQLVDTWTFLKISTQGWKILLMEAELVLQKTQIGAMNLVNLAREKVGLEKAYISDLVIAWNLMLDQEKAIEGAREKGARMMDDLGQGAVNAERIIDAMNGARSGGVITLDVDTEIETPQAQIQKAGKVDPAEVFDWDKWEVELDASTDRLTSALDRVIEEIKGQMLAAFESIATSSGQIIGAFGTFAGIAADNRADTLEEARANLRALDSEATEAERRAAEDRVRISKEATKRAFNLQKTASIAQATINGAVAIVRALAELGPIVGAVAATAIGATTAAQIGVIAAQQPFAEGGIVGDIDRARVAARTGDPRQRLALLEQGEGILTPQGVASVGGAEGVAAANAGRAAPAAATTRAAIVFSGRTLDSLLMSGVAAGGRFARSLRPALPAGAVNPYLAIG